MVRPAPASTLRQLHRDGPAISTSLAHARGENTGATSYHLRQLAEHGFVEEVPERRRGRERWWRARTRDIRFPPRSRMDEEVRAAFDELGRLNVADDVAAFARFQQQRDSLGEWGDALLFARGGLRLTLPQVRRFWEDYMALYNRYASDEPSGDAQRVLLRFVAFPDVE